MAFIIVAVIVVVALAVPRYGLFAQLGQHRRQKQRASVEDTLKHLLEQEYRGRRASFSSVAGTLRLSDSRLMTLLGSMEKQGLLRTTGQEFLLTPEGERLAIHVVRAHRLLERYLADEARLPLGRIHSEAERREHGLSASELDRLEAALGHPAQDPHGDPIPTREGYIAPAEGRPLTDWHPGATGRVVHLEDEPPLSFAQIVAEGLHIGQVVQVTEVTGTRIVVTDGRQEYRLAPAVAANVFLSADGSQTEIATDVLPLSALDDGTDAEIVSLNDACQGYTRRRLLDLGFTPGTHLRADLTTFTHDPRAYRVRGTLVALRREQADQILVRKAS